MYVFGLRDQDYSDMVIEMIKYIFNSMFMRLRKYSQIKDEWFFTILEAMYVLCMYVCMVITYSRVWINLVRLPILLVVS